MKRILFSLFVITLLFVQFFACKKEEDKAASPIVVTASVDSILNTSARVGGNVSSDGGSEVTERGIYWSTSTNPETTGTKLQIGSGTGIYFDKLVGLTKGVKYYVKAYATNSKGTSYGLETTFTTQINLPTVETSAVTEYTLSTAKVGGTVSDNGGYPVTQRGVFWGIKSNTLLNGTKLVIGSGDGEFSQTLTGLTRAVTYYVMAFATNIKGTTYGSEISFTTVPELATVNTVPATKITTTTATIGGNIDSNGGAEVTERGFYLGTSTSPQTTGSKIQVGVGSGAFYNDLSSLGPGVTYYFVAYAINSVGTSYGEEKSFTTNGKAPVAVTFEVIDILASSATVKGKVETNDLSTAVSFEYGTTTSYGNTIDAVGSPTIQAIDTLSAIITGLSPFTTYHYRVKAMNELGTVYGVDSTFTTVLTGIVGTPVSDADGNSYPNIGIGKLYWMTKNLRTTKYNDGSKIPSVKKDSLWNTLTTPGYCWYGNDSTANSNTYGALYNWYTVNTNKLCPSGWRIPSSDEIAELFDYLGGASDAGKFLKESGTAHWNNPNAGTNKFGFTALPGGNRTPEGIFDFKGVQGNWWTASNYSTLTATYFYMLYNYNNSFQSFIHKKNGMSVRCVKN